MTFSQLRQKRGLLGGQYENNLLVYHDFSIAQLQQALYGNERHKYPRLCRIYEGKILLQTLDNNYLVKGLMKYHHDLKNGEKAEWKQ